MLPAPSPRTRSDRRTSAVLLLCSIAAVALILRLLAECRFGIDLTDESFYLAWMRAPSTWKASVLLFGFVYHPLYVLCGGSVALLRRVNVLVTFALAVPPCVLVLGGMERLTRWALALTLAAPALLLFVVWLPVPSYNGLALHALLLAATGMLLAERPAARAQVAAALLIGGAGWLAWMAKPTTAAALATVVLGWAITARTLRPRLVALAAVVTATGVVLAALAIDGSSTAHVARLRGGAELLRLLDAGHSANPFARLWPVPLGARAVVLLVVAGALVAVFTTLATSARSGARAVALGAAALFTLAAGAVTVGSWIPLHETRPQDGLQLLAVPLGLFAAALWPARGRVAARVPRPDLALAAALALFPFVHAFGGSASLWAGAGKVAFFWLLAALVLVRRRLALLPAAACALAVTSVLLAMAMARPTRQPVAPLVRAEDFGAPGHPIMVSAAVGDYLAGLRATAAAARFRAGDPVIDLTGHAPGVLYALDARPLGQPWLIGGYPGSAAFARAALDRERCEDLARAWILVEDGGPRRLPAEVLQAYGIDVRRDLASAGPVWTATGELPRPYVQRLLRPARDPEAALAACRGARATP